MMAQSGWARGCWGANGGALRAITDGARGARAQARCAAGHGCGGDSALVAPRPSRALHAPPGPRTPRAPRGPHEAGWKCARRGCTRGAGSTRRRWRLSCVRGVGAGACSTARHRSSNPVGFVRSCMQTGPQGERATPSRLRSRVVWRASGGRGRLRATRRAFAPRWSVCLFSA
jgi:hypothetical protein